MASRTSPVRLLSNYMDKNLEVPKWIKRKSMNDRLNYIVRMYSETCGDNWYLWIETAIETLPMLIYSLLAISTVDVFKELLEREYRCGVRQAAKKGKRQANAVAKRGSQFFWKIEAVRGRLFWWWLIAESVTAYVINWQSIVVQEQRCEHPPHAGPCVLDTPGSTIGAGVAPTTLFWNTREYDPSGWSGAGPHPTVIAPNAVGTYNVGANITAVWPGQASTTFHIAIFDGNGTQVAVSGSQTVTAGQTGTASCFGVCHALTIGQAQFLTQVIVTAVIGIGFGSCPTGTFSVGLSQ